MMATSGRFELDGAMTVDDVPDVRRFVERMQRRHVGAHEASRVAMATHELLENAVKFSCDGTASVRVDVVPGSRISIVTRNRATEADREDLSQFARELRAAPDPLVFYIDLMRRSPTAVRGGLGLGRVAAEGDMQIDLRVDGDVVEVRAEGPLGDGVR